MKFVNVHAHTYTFVSVHTCCTGTIGVVFMLASAHTAKLNMHMHAYNVQVTDEQHLEFYRFIGNAWDEPKNRLWYNADVPVSIKVSHCVYLCSVR